MLTLCVRYPIFLLATGLVAVSVLASCSDGSATGPAAAPSRAAPTSGPAESSPPPATATRKVTMADAKACPVTRPSRFDPPPGVEHEVLFGADFSYGNGQLWVGGLWPTGIIAAEPYLVEPDGSIGIKLGWYRVASGELTITGRRTDGPAPPAWADVPSGYGDSGFQASGVHFPTEGCWEITGTVGSASLTFVTFIIKA